MLSLPLPRWKPCAIPLTLPFHQDHSLVICTTGNWGLLKIVYTKKERGNTTGSQKATHKTHQTKKPKLDQAEQYRR